MCISPKTFNPDFIVEVKEELIEYDPKTKTIKRCCIIIEKAFNTLDDGATSTNTPTKA